MVPEESATKRAFKACYFIQIVGDIMLKYCSRRRLDKWDNDQLKTNYCICNGNYFFMAEMAYFTSTLTK